jgi:hypothetical protein
VEIDFRINARRFDGPMAKNRCDVFEPHICAEHLARGGMPKNMGSPPPTLNAGTLQRDLCNVFNRAARPVPSERSKGSYRAQEDVVAFDSWTPDSQVLQQGVPHVLGKWQLDLATSLSRNSDAARLEADIVHA